MKPEQYNSKAREAFGKSLVDIGVSIFKGIIALFTVVPITAVVKSAVEGKDAKVSILDFFVNMTNTTLFIIVVFIFVAFQIGHFFRKEGLRHIHEAKNKK